MKGRKVPFEIDVSLKETCDPLTAEEFWSLREGMTVHVLVASHEMVEGIFKCGHASGSLLSFVKGKPYTGFYFEKEDRTDGQASDRSIRLLGKILQAER